MDFNWIDALIFLALGFGLIRGLMKGLVTELIAIVAVVLGVVGARLWGAAFAGWCMKQFTWPESVCTVVAYVLLFLSITVVCNILGRLLSKLLKAIHLGWANRLLGGVFGCAKWAVVVLVVVFLLDTLDQNFHFLKSDLKKSSITYQPAVKTANACISEFRSQSGR